MSAAKTRPSLRSPWQGGTLSLLLMGLVVSTGCRSCSADKAAKKKARKDIVKKEKKPPGPSIGSMVTKSTPRSQLKATEMRGPKAPEDAREVAPEVAAARDLILSGDKAQGAEARTQLGEYLKANETNADAHYWMGRAWMQERIAVPSIEQFELAIQHDPEFIGARKWTAAALHKENRCADALVHLDKVISARPDEADPLVDRAVCHMALNDWDKAIVDLDAYCGKKADDPICADVTKLKELIAKRPEGSSGKRLTAEERKARQAEGANTDKPVHSPALRKALDAQKK